MCWCAVKKLLTHSLSCCLSVRESHRCYHHFSIFLYFLVIRVKYLLYFVCWNVVDLLRVVYIPIVTVVTYCYIHNHTWPDDHDTQVILHMYTCEYYIHCVYTLCNLSVIYCLYVDLICSDTRTCLSVWPFSGFYSQSLQLPRSSPIAVPRLHHGIPISHRKMGDWNRQCRMPMQTCGFNA